LSGAEIEQLLTSYQLIFILVGSFLFGETIIITAAFLSTKMGWSPIVVFLLSFLGTITSDVCWFILGKYFSDNVKKSKFWKNKYPKKRALVRKIVINPKTTLFYYKFLYGFRVLSILYVAGMGMTTADFVLFNSLGTFIWLIVIISIGWFAGKGILNVLPYVSSIEYYIFIVVLLLIAMRILASWVGRKIVKE
jgi:membrane protein DedA with SNARE-associated domain